MVAAAANPTGKWINILLLLPTMYCAVFAAWSRAHVFRTIMPGWDKIWFRFSFVCSLVCRIIFFVCVNAIMVVPSSMLAENGILTVPLHGKTKRENPAMISTSFTDTVTHPMDPIWFPNDNEKKWMDMIVWCWWKFMSYSGSWGETKIIYVIYGQCMWYMGNDIFSHACLSMLVHLRPDYEATNIIHDWREQFRRTNIHFCLSRKKKR